MRSFQRQKQRHKIEKIDESLFQIDEDVIEEDKNINKILIFNINDEGTIIDYCVHNIEDDHNNTGEMFAGDMGIQFPEEKGLWIYEGDYVYNDDYGDIKMNGKYRRPTFIELEKMAFGEKLWNRKFEVKEYYEL